MEIHFYGIITISSKSIVIRIKSEEKKKKNVGSNRSILCKALGFQNYSVGLLESAEAQVLITNCLYLGSTNHNTFFVQGGQFTELFIR